MANVYPLILRSSYIAQTSIGERSNDIPRKGPHKKRKKRSHTPTYQYNIAKHFFVLVYQDKSMQYISLQLSRDRKVQRN